MFTRERLTRWTDALRESPEQQIAETMTDGSGKGFCCLGKLCDIEGLSPNEANNYGDGQGFLPSNLEFDLCGTTHRESEKAKFRKMDMPDLEYDDKTYPDAAQANDAGVPWPVIADHFDKYYPCSDEQ